MEAGHITVGGRIWVVGWKTRTRRRCKDALPKGRQQIRNPKSEISQGNATHSSPSHLAPHHPSRAGYLNGMCPLSEAVKDF